MHRIERLDSRTIVFLPLLVALSLAPVSPAHAISSRTLFTPTGAAVGDILGTSVASAGDVNGDGYAAVIVGARLRATSAGDSRQRKLAVVR